MRTDDFRPSDNVEDDREASASRGGMPGGAGGLGIGTIIILGLIGWAFGIDPSVLINGAEILTGGGATSQQSGPAPPVDRRHAARPTGNFVAAVLGDTEDRWTEIFAAIGRTYHPPKLRLFARSSGRLRHGAVGHGAVLLPAAIGRSISIPRSSTTCRTSSTAARAATPASSPRPMSSRTKSAITCRTSSASCRA